MLYAGLDLSRQRLDVHVLDEEGRTVEVSAVRPDADALRTLANRVLRHGGEVSAAIESMTGSRFVHDQLELAGWDVMIAAVALEARRAGSSTFRCARTIPAPAAGSRRHEPGSTL
jgi:N-acyl-D-aspartate/D-glutamate deacylase